jgi:hypothetical protein
MEFCKPIWAKGSPDDQKAVDAVYTQVEKTMQQTMDRLYEDRTPIIGR